jgi:cytochrome b561
MNQTSSRYTKTAIILHWLIALGIFAMFALGWYMSDLPKKAPDQASFDLFDFSIYTLQLAEPISPRAFYFNLHKSIGITLLALILIRILWRVTHKPPPLLASYKAMERKLATGAHHTLYLLMLAVPISGVVMGVYSKYGVKWFGIDFLGGLDNKGIRETFAEIHEVVGIILLVIIVLHVIGALKHKLIDKDNTMQRMSLK